MIPIFKFEFINQEKAWKEILTDFSTTKKFRNSFYLDKKPSCKMYWINDQLRLFDFGDSRFQNLNLVKAYMLRYNITELEAKLRLLEFKGSTTPKSKGFSPKRKDMSTKSIYFEAVERGWEHYDEVFWSKYGFKKRDLEPDLKPCWYFIFYSAKFGGNIRIYSSPEDPIYMWTFPSGRQKIYAPLSEFHKWMGNANNEDVYFYTRESNSFILASGSKDAKTLFKYTKCDVGALQGEKRFPPDHLVETLKRYKNIYISLDGDKDGLEWNEKIYTYLKEKGLPVKVIKCPKINNRKDWSDHLEFNIKKQTELFFLNTLTKIFKI